MRVELRGVEGRREDVQMEIVGDVEMEVETGRERELAEAPEEVAKIAVSKHRFWRPKLTNGKKLPREEAPPKGTFQSVESVLLCQLSRTHGRRRLKTLSKVRATILGC